MKHKQQATISNLIRNGTVPEFGNFEVTSSIIDAYCDTYGRLFAKNDGIGKHSTNIQFAKKIAFLNLTEENQRRIESVEKVVKPRNKSKSGFVYIVANEIFPDMYKIGITNDINKRLTTYQTYDPLRRYRIVHYKYVDDKRQTEKNILEKFKFNVAKGEWIEYDRAIKLIRASS